MDNPLTDGRHPLIASREDKLSALATAVCVAAGSLALGGQHGFRQPCPNCDSVVRKAFGPPQMQMAGLTIVWPVIEEDGHPVQRSAFVPHDEPYFAVWTDTFGTTHAAGSGRFSSELDVFDAAVNTVLDHFALPEQEE